MSTSLLDHLDEGQRRQIHVPPELENLTRGKIEPSVDDSAALGKLQVRRNRLITSYFSADLATAANGLVIMSSLHLPEDADVCSIYLENPGSTASVGIAQGASGAAATFMFSPAKHGEYKVYAMPDGIRAVSIVASATGDSGLVAVILTTRRWSPKTGTL